VASSGAFAQTVTMLVNGDPITSFDIEQRTRLLTLMGSKALSRHQVLDELIDEKLKLQLPKRFDFSSLAIDTDVDNAFSNMARRAHKSAKEFTDQLASQGVQIYTLKSRIKAEIVWTNVIRGKYQASFQFNDTEILAAAEGRGTENKTSYDYTLRPIVFIVPRGSSEAVFEARKRQAEGLRARFQTCEEGIPLTRALSDPIIREPVIRSTADLMPALREILEKTEVGKLTPPERTLQGIEFYALCGKKLSSADNSVVKREARDELYSKQFQSNAKRYLKELREQAYCTMADGRVIPKCASASVVSK
jgi:peptidyl-prolyl cis-trans isomerase SurA